jgi:hypothetical protein
MNIMIDCFTIVDELPKRKQNYENIKALVLRTGRFSVFDGCDHPRIFDKLCKDPELEILRDESGYGLPWIGVRRKEGEQG